MSQTQTALTPAVGLATDKKPMVWAGLTSFFLMWSFLYICLVVFRPSWVCVVARGGEVVAVDTSPYKTDPQIDQARAFVVALIITLVVMLIVWLVLATASASK